MLEFEDWFRSAAGREPQAWLAGVAREGLPESLEVPSLASKSDIIAAWLWRYLHSFDNSKKREARRLIYALPQGAIIEPVASAVRGWLARLGLAEQVGLHLSMGMWAATEGPDWRADMHQPAIVIGTTEYLVSKALNRAFGVSSTSWSIDFALVTNGAQWVVHEERLSRQAAATLRGAAAVAGRWGTAEPFGLTAVTCASERVRSVPRLRGVERAALAAGPGELLVVAPATAAGTPASAEPAALSVRELLALFDTEGGVGEEASPFCLEGGGTGPDIGIAWATWTPGEDGRPAPEVRFPAAEWRCPVPLGQVGELARDRAVWRWDDEGRWVRVSDVAEVRPFTVLLVSATDGGYDPVGGFDPAARSPVPGCPQLRTPEENAALQAEIAALALLAGESAEPAEAAEEAPQRPWQTLNSHSEETRDQAAALVRALRAAIPAAAAASAVLGAYLHDVGKGHPTWQDALCSLAPEPDAAAVQAGRPWAKSGHGASGRLEFADGVSFLHELASLLIIDSPLRGLLAAAPDADLCRYLVLAHHGRLRMRVAEQPDDAEPEAAAGPEAAAVPPPGARVMFGLEQGTVSVMPPLLGQDESELTVDLTQFGSGGDDSAWHQTAAGLLDRYGPFRLAYLETVVRIADWRASGHRELPG
ncbi:MAG: CRISPR-associated endonuclease/helicase Cas3 [Actinomycetia bacterium]|nr:CRISPR-associated endonuclease/helicase Cas3 [Actinomycetes bacterium]